MPTIEQWRDAWAQLGTRADDALFAAVSSRYREPHRHYHTLQHLDECLRNAELLRTVAARPAEVILALWFHDAIYDVARSDNELLSANWARDSTRAAGLSSDVGERIHKLILATQHDAVPADADAQALLDVDLWILGAPTPRFDEYELQVRREYSDVPEPAFRNGRTRVLTTFLKREFVFNTLAFRSAFEDVARNNLARSIAQLS